MRTRLPVLAVLGAIAVSFAFALPAFLSAAPDRSGGPPAWDHVADATKTLTLSTGGTQGWKFGVNTILNVRDFGAIPDDGLDDATAINNAIGAVGTSGNPRGLQIFIPRGTYRLSSSIRLNRQVVLFGDGGAGQYSASILQPDKNVIGIVFDRGTTSTDGGAGDWSVVRDISIQYASQTTGAWAPTHAYVLGDTVASLTTGSGVNAVAGANWNPDVIFKVTTAGTSASSEPAWASKTEGQTITDGGVTWTAIVGAGVRMRSRGKVENIYISNSPGSCFRVDGNSGGSPSTNANGWHLQYARFIGCAQNGIFATGADSNAGQAAFVDVAFCGYWGVNEQSFLGNSHLGHQVDGCGLGPYRSAGASSANVFVGCYSESGQPPSDVNVPALVFGGLQGAGFTSTSTAAQYMGAGLVAGHPGIFGGPTFSNRSSTHATVFQATPSADLAMEIGGDTTSLGFTFGPHASTGDSNYGWWDWLSESTQSVMRWSSNSASEGHGRMWIPRGFLLGDGSGQRMSIESGQSKPTGSAYRLPTYTTGSIKFNTEQTPQSGGGHGLFGWQLTYQANSPSNGTLHTIRWPHFGVTNEIDATNQSGSPYVIDSFDEAGVMFTNLGATGKTYFTLPSDSGFPSIRTTEFGFYVADSDGIRLTLPANHDLHYGSYAAPTGGYIESTTIGSWIRVKVQEQSAGHASYVATELAGKWTDSGSSGFSAPRGPTSATANNLASYSDTSGAVLADSGVPLANVVLVSRNVTAGTGLTGGGALTSDITLALAGASYQTITATGSTQGNATQMDGTAVQVVSGSGGIKLPTTVTAYPITVVDNTGNNNKVYPASGHSIIGLSANASVNPGPQFLVTFYPATSTSWAAVIHPWLAEDGTSNKGKLFGPLAINPAGLAITIGGGSASIEISSGNILCDSSSCAMNGDGTHEAWPHQGTKNADNATAGYVGEVISSCVTAASGTTLSNGTAANITSVSLTAGDWNVDALGGLTGTLTGTDFQAGVSATSGTLGTKGDDTAETPTTSTALADVTLAVPGVRKNVSSTTTVYLVEQASFSVGTAKGYGCIKARRAR